MWVALKYFSPWLTLDIFYLPTQCSTFDVRPSFSIAVQVHDRILPCIMRSHIFGPTFKKKIFRFNFLIQLFIYLYLQTKPIIIFQGIILHVDIIVAF